MITSTRSAIYTGASLKAISIAALPEDAWTPLSGDKEPTQVQTYAASVAFLFRAIEVRANALVAVPWQITRGESEDPLWASTDEDPPASLQWLTDFPGLLWRTAVSWCFYNQAYWLKERNRVRVLAVRWLDPDSVTPLWDKQQGLVGYERRLGTEVLKFGVDDIAYLWRQGLRETTPTTPPAQAAMQAAGVLYHADEFAAGFFERGAIKATLLTVEGNPPDADVKRLEAWWKRFASGVKNAWNAPAVRGGVTAVPVGEGLESLSNASLTTEKRQDIATALGVPHSLVMADAANYATAQQDEQNFYNLTVIPDCLLIQRQLNRQLFAPLGYRLKFNPQEMTVFQADETQRATAFAAYVNAGIKLSIAAEMLGLNLPAGVEYADLDEEEKPEDEPPTAEEPADEEDGQGGQGQEAEQGRQMPMAGAMPDSERDAEVKRFRRWLKKRPNADPCEFKSAILDTWELTAIATGAQPSDTGAPFPVDDWSAYP